MKWPRGKTALQKPSNGRMQDLPSAERKSRDTRHETQYYYNQNKPKIHYGTSCNHPRHFVWHLQHPRCQPSPLSAGAKGVYPPSGRLTSTGAPRCSSETSVEFRADSIFLFVSQKSQKSQKGLLWRLLRVTFRMENFCAFCAFCGTNK